jgi:hypothetical protein
MVRTRSSASVAVAHSSPTSWIVVPLMIFNLHVRRTPWATTPIFDDRFNSDKACQPDVGRVR